MASRPTLSEKTLARISAVSEEVSNYLEERSRGAKPEPPEGRVDLFPDDDWPGVECVIVSTDILKKRSSGSGYSLYCDYSTTTRVPIVTWLIKYKGDGTPGGDTTPSTATVRATCAQSPVALVELMKKYHVHESSWRNMSYTSSESKHRCSSEEGKLYCPYIKQ